MEFGIASVAGITVICYLAAQAVKATNLDNKWLPVILSISPRFISLGSIPSFKPPPRPLMEITNCT